MNSKNLKTAVVMIALLCLGVARLAHATTMLALSLEDLVARADEIVLGTVVRAQSRWSKPGSVIVTDAEVRVDQSLKGTSADGDTLLVTTLGGAVGDIALTVPGAAELKPGHQTLLFLRHKKGSKSLHVVGMSQGAIQVRVENGISVVDSAQGGAELVETDANGKLAKSSDAPLKSLVLNDLLSQIKSLVH